MEKISVAFTPDEPARQISVARFEELFEIAYFRQLQCADWDVENWLRKKCAWAHKTGRIKQLALWLGKLHGAQIDSGAIPDITVRWIGEHMGYGAFTTRPLKQWEYIGEYTGLLRRRKIIFPDINDYCFMYPREWLSLRSYTIDSKACGNLTRYINHSDTPNCESVSVYHGGLFHIIFRATQPIPAGIQLTYDYGDIYWNKRKKIVDEPIETLIAPEDFKKLLTDS